MVEANGPAVDKHLFHVGDADLAAGLLELGVGAGHALTDVEVLQRQHWADVVHLLPGLDGKPVQVDQHLGRVWRAPDQHDAEGAADRTGSAAGAEGLVLGLGGFAQREEVELEILGCGIITDYLGCSTYLFDGERV